MIYFVSQGMNVVDFLIDFFKEKIELYRIEEITDGAMGNIPNIMPIHPLFQESVQYTSSGNNTYDSVLPAISIEYANEEDSIPKLGYTEQLMIFNQESLDAIKMSDIIKAGARKRERLRRGYIISETQIAEIEQMMDTAAAKEPVEKLYTRRYQYAGHENITISVWADSSEKRDMLNTISKALLLKGRKEISKEFRLKDLRISTNNGLVNMEFGRTLFGAEIRIRYMNNIQDFTISSDIQNEIYNSLELNLETTKFVTIGQKTGEELEN